MKRAHSMQREIVEAELSIDTFIGINTFGPHADIRVGELRQCTNFDTYQDYIQTRRGSQAIVQDLCPDLDILNGVVFDSGEREYAIIQQKNGAISEFRFVDVSFGGLWTTVKHKTSLANFTMATTVAVDMMISNQKVYLFSPVGNSIFEYDAPNFRFLRRKMGLPALQIKNVTEIPGAGGAEIKGKHCWGVELVYKNTSVTPNVDVIVSGPNRAIVLDNPEYQEGRLAIGFVSDPDFSETSGFLIKTVGLLNDGSLLNAAENDNWTHARLYRSKDVTTATNATPGVESGSEITGTYDELYLLQEMTRADFLSTSSDFPLHLATSEYTFETDLIGDDNIPYPLDYIEGDRLDLIPVPKAKVGVFHRNRIWCSGITEIWGPNGNYALEAIKSKIYYSPEVDTKYSEQVQPISAIESIPGDGEEMIALFSFDGDLLGIKQGKTGRVREGNPNAGWVTDDEVIGISTRQAAQFVPNVGICAIVNDQKDFRIFGFDMQWHSDFNGLQVSRPIREVIKNYALNDLDFFYMNGKLFLNSGVGEFLVLAVEQQRGWVTYNYPLQSKSELAFTYNEGRQAAIINPGQEVIEIEVDGRTQDYDTGSESDVEIDWNLETHKWQDAKGRSLIEHRYLSIVAILQRQVSIQPYVNGQIWDVPFGVLLDPEDYPNVQLQETEYQGYPEYKPVGNYIHHVISGTEPATIYSIMLNCLVQRGSIAPGFDPFNILANVNRVPPWALIGNDDIIETGTQPDNYIETGTASTNIVEQGI